MAAIQKLAININRNRPKKTISGERLQKRLCRCNIVIRAALPLVGCNPGADARSRPLLNMPTVELFVIIATKQALKEPPLDCQIQTPLGYKALRLPVRIDNL